MTRNVTLLKLVSAVAKYARSDKEVIATVASMVNSGRVRLGGNFKGTRFDLDALAPPFRPAVAVSPERASDSVVIRRRELLAG